MGLMDRFRGKTDKQDERPSASVRREGVPAGFNQEEPMLNISDAAKEKIAAVLGSQDPPVQAIRVSSPAPGKYSMNLEPGGKPGLDDTVLPYEGFEIYIDPQSLPSVEGASLDWVDTFGGGGFQFSNPNAPLPGGIPRKEPPEGPEGEVWRQIQEILDEEVNPAVAGHGGFINLIDVQGGTVYVLMGGGCQGCGMANVTLKQGVETILRSHLPQIEQVLDVTDHAGGTNPYYAPSTK